MPLIFKKVPGSTPECLESWIPRIPLLLTCARVKAETDAIKAKLSDIEVKLEEEVFNSEERVKAEILKMEERLEKKIMEVKESWWKVNTDTDCLFHMH